ncbi:lytic murein transglycosylase B [Kingella negevensis]|uniref:Membrane-bound lytic murein transglycosylase B n=1 Tax=Kingella negevensis TaxID=1522312 RepID=A0A238TCB0_9NEIS|nr:lytic murein transglycosylase B [Kingella negevensis]MDK4684191.1 lytic murein transglycosylase B [Kingella negevensis]MDK4696791.1 lytic murein transglycosylase B [Kingella negevensis]MDK4707976.1 lytic murein transglycosylase B [Kingella negevensis]MDK4709494.1 lytic murein transglycosylase B [Kingella negevensis]SNB73408.1 Membrane-bound lytic murein transglycosylase B precursor [Kingella negevensis]
MKKIAYTITTAFILAACSSEPTATRTTQTQDPLKDILVKKTTVVTPAQNTQPENPFFNQSSAPVSQTGFLANPNVQAFIQYQNQKNGLDINYLTNFFSQVNYRGNLINTMNRPATSTPWYKFKTGNSGAAKINPGRTFYQQNRSTINTAANRYGVPAELIVAILGIETNYGKNAGNVRTADSLATLAFDYPRRGALFQKELGEFLKMAQEENRDPFSFSGSFAGAMGMPQFMPSSFRQYAVDADGDGKRNIWSSKTDVAASVGNYMKQHGWQTGKPMIVPAAVQETAQIIKLTEENTALNYTVGQLRQMGVQPLQPVADNERALLYRLEVAPNQYDYFIGLNNFYTVWNYNHSRMYVTAVRDIANGLGGRL